MPKIDILRIMKSIFWISNQSWRQGKIIVTIKSVKLCKSSRRHISKWERLRRRVIPREITDVKNIKVRIRDKTNDWKCRNVVKTYQQKKKNV